MKRTPFHNLHKEAGAKLVNFAGYEMPLQYTSIIEEHRCVRERVGVFDVSHMGEFEIAGKNARDFVQKMTTNDVLKLSPGKVQYSVFCYDHGGIVDDLLVYERENRFLLVVNAANIEKDFTWLQAHCPSDISLTNRSDEFALLAVQGPQSIATLQKLTDIPLSEIKYYSFVEGTLASVEMLISRTGYTGEIGFELYLRADPSSAETVWRALMQAGKEFGIQPIGLGARDTLRLEMGFRLYGNDIDETTNPLEADMGWITKLQKGDFIGRAALEKVKESGLTRRLVGFVIREEKAVARHGNAIRDDSTAVGTVTSGTISPTLGKAIGMGYVLIDWAVPGTLLNIDIRGRSVEAEVVRLPFLQK